jgi:PEGA domain
MNKSQERTFSMLLLVLNYFKNNTAITSGIPQFTNVFTAFEVTINDIIEIEQTRISDDSQIQTSTKKDLRMQCTAQLETLIEMLRAHAAAINDIVLLQKLNQPFSKIKILADTAFAADCNKYYTMAQPFEADLIPYGITAAKMTVFLQDITDYTNIITTPRATIIGRAEATVLLKEKFATAKKQLETLTIFATTKRLTKPSFYSQFIKSSKIIDNGSTPRALSIALKDETGTPLRAFTFTFTRLADGKAFEYKTNENGTIVRQFFKEGTYSLSISKSSYTTYTGTVEIEAGTTYKITATANSLDKTITV